MSIRPPGPLQLTEQFLSFADQQLEQLNRNHCFQHLAVYVSQAGESNQPPLVLIRQLSVAERTLPPAEADLELRRPAQERRWYPLRNGELILGALRADLVPEEEWHPPRDQQLRDAATALSYGLARDLECLHLRSALDQQQSQLRTMVHQLRNPLSALRTYAQLLLRRLESSSEYRPLVEGMLAEQNQINSYINALEGIGQPALSGRQPETAPLMLPPNNSAAGISVKQQLMPLIERAKATATLQGRPWHGPEIWPAWGSEPSRGTGTAEIVANLLENAFRYSPPGTAIGLKPLPDGLCIWDGGPAIDIDEREAIFQEGVRGRRGRERAGTGLGLALARQLAERDGGRLELCVEPSRLAAELPEQGNAFQLKWPEP
ncbi:MAG: HAMP domain-containing sensor histidine kinase, partial [Cyanobacteriota bacterium]|nr:HAMP domain-containing sensor histidine kinase [Cyanobacteriota bacterium]